MRTRQYKSDPKALLEEGKKLIKTINDEKYRHKVEIVNLVISGINPKKLSDVCKESKSTIYLWVKLVDENGFEALCPKKRNGRPTKLSDQQCLEIKAVLELDNSKEHGYSVWDGPNLSDYIKKKYGIDLSVRQCQRLFHKLGFSLVRPQTYPSKNESNKKERETFKKN